MAYLITSLRHVFDELNAVWPHRAHQLDGWIGDSHHCPGSSDHCADSQGRVHAIDIDKNGIDPYYVIGRLSNVDKVVRYINYNRQQWHVRNDFRPTPLGGDDPHVNHIHVSAEHTDYARNYAGGWGIFNPYPVEEVIIPELTTTSQEQWDHSQLIFDVATEFFTTGSTLGDYANAISGLRF